LHEDEKKMTPEYVVSVGMEAVKLTLLLSLPLLGVGLVVGLLIAVLQATTQIQEMTLSFVPKILSVLLALLVAAPWMLNKMTYFTSYIITSIPQAIR
jgi:flagellar biosynthetic protein FliQ